MRTGIVLRRLRSGGYTITEAMIFLAVSTGLFLIIATQINGQQSRSDFGQSAHNFESRLLDLANDVSTGFYTNSNNFSCAGTPNLSPTISGAGGNNQGTNDGCILAGQIIEMPAGGTTFTITPIAGTQKATVAGQTREVRNLTEAHPIKIDLAAITERIGSGLVINKVTYNIASTEINARGAAFFTTFGQTGSSGLASSDINVNLMPLIAPTTNLAATLAVVPTVESAANGITITICLQDGPTPRRHAELVLGGRGRQLSTRIDIFDNTATCSP